MQSRKLLTIVATLSLATVLACGGGGDETPAPTSTTPAAPAATAPDLSQAGSVGGGVMLAGEAPAAQPIGMEADPFCQSAHSEAVMSSPVMVDANGGLMNVVVHVSSGLDGYTFETPADGVTLDQQGCRYEPHVIALQTGQTLTVLNSDDTLHNVNVQPSAAGNEAFNQGQPISGMTLERTFDTAEVGIPARCDVHPWMGAFISVFEHPYFAITGADGSFQIERLPPGDYVLEAWHETLGTQTQSVTIAPNGAAEASFSFGS